MTGRQASPSRGELRFARRPDGTLVAALGGAWLLASKRPAARELERELDAHAARRVEFDASALLAWDSALVTFLARTLELLEERRIEADRAGLPSGVRRLLALAEAVPEKQGARAAASPEPWLARLGRTALAAVQGTRDFVAFLGEATLAAGNLLRMRARFQGADLLLFLQSCGAQALPIVTLISFLVGLILAFVGAVQLAQFGATIYVADLVAVGMAREMGAIMTGVIMAGRTGAAFAAQLGTMKVTQEIDALRTLGIDPIEFLVLPRMIALSLMMPLLCIYADFVGMVGGATVSVGLLGINAAQYTHQTLHAATLTQFGTGIVKSAVFGVLIAVAGCLRGMQCGSSASAVGDAATSAVVTIIVLIVVADGLFAVLFNILGI